MPCSSSCSAIHSYASHWIWSGPELNTNKSYMCDTTQWGFFHGRHMRAIRWPLGGLPCLDIIQKASRMLRLEAAVKHPNTSEVQALLQLYWPPPDSKQQHERHGSSTASLAHPGYRQASQRYDLATCWDFFHNQATRYGPSLALLQVCFGIWEQPASVCVAGQLQLWEISELW
jgi:hypothetical protein